MDINDVPDTGPGDPSRDHNLDRFVELLEERAKAAVSALNDLNEAVGQVAPLCLGYPIDLHARTTIALQDAREAASYAKTRLTAADAANSEWFSARILAEGEERYEMNGFTFKASGKGIYSLPGQSTRKAEFLEALRWLEKQKVSVPLKYDVDAEGIYRVENLDEVCRAIREANLPMHRLIGEHVVAQVKITKRP